MRIYLHLSQSELIPFNYQKFLTGAIHKWIGEKNEWHGEVAMFSFSWLQNVETFKNGIKTKPGSYFFISALDENLIKKIVSGIRNDATVFFGACVKEIRLAETPQFEKVTRFQYGSPILVKRTVDNKSHHYTYSDPETEAYLTETLKFKLSKAGISSDDILVRFDLKFANPRTKIISYGDIQNRVNLCPIIIEGSPEQIAFAWHVGVGSSTGVGFGALK